MRHVSVCGAGYKWSIPLLGAMVIGICLRVRPAQILIEETAPRTYSCDIPAHGIQDSGLISRSTTARWTPQWRQSHAHQEPYAVHIKGGRLNSSCVFLHVKPVKQTLPFQATMKHQLDDYSRYRGSDVAASMPFSI